VQYKLNHIHKYDILTLNLLTTTIVAPPSNASKCQVGFKLAFKGLKVFAMCDLLSLICCLPYSGRYPPASLSVELVWVAHRVTPGLPCLRSSMVCEWCHKFFYVVPWQSIDNLYYINWYIQVQALRKMKLMLGLL
jgi:hypothetical protein